MTQPPDSRHSFSIDEHPTSLLAAYVDGEATPAERIQVERHLGACAVCRSEVETARAAAEAMRSLPMVEGPALDAAKLRAAAAKADEEDLRPVISIRERRRDRRPMVATALGLAAAAAIAGAVVFTLGRGGGSGAGSTAVGGTAAQAPAGHQLTQQDLRQLTDTLVQTERAASGQQTLAGSGGAGEASAGANTPEPETALSPSISSPPSRVAAASPVSIDPAAAAGVACARRASGQDVSAQVVYAQEGVFAGKRVDVIGFVSPPEGGGPAHVTVVAVPVGECSIAFLAREAVS